MTIPETTIAILRDLAGRPRHNKVQAGFAELLVAEFGVERAAINFEVHAPLIAGRLDVLVGRTVFEAKSDLDAEWDDVTRRMPDYLADCEREAKQPFVGLASDGRKWVALERAGEGLAVLTRTELDPAEPARFLAWLEGVVALKDSLSPDPLTVRLELGRDSVAYARAAATLERVWARLRDDPAVALKRALWAGLLKLVHGREAGSDALWLQHSFLVIVAKAVAGAVLDIREDDPARLLSGAAFADAGILGAVEGDFFDWPLADPEGRKLVERVAAHARRFRLHEVESDVLKVLYESLIDREERHGLGEYYTPDWLAAKVVRRAVANPAFDTVLDPACGSGTFLFHALRLALSEAEANDVAPARLAAHAAGLVTGLDVHPVAVIIARVTCLLALAPALAKRAGPLSIPVYLGDAMQLSVTQNFTERDLVIAVPEGGGGGATRLVFPEVFCREPPLFDALVAALGEASEAGLTPARFEARAIEIVDAHRRQPKPLQLAHLPNHATQEDIARARDLAATYATFDSLRRAGRDTVWSYVARNLSRPLALAAGSGWASVLVGNPPWVAYRHMSADLQVRFKELAKGERVHVGAKLATQNDLCALFTARAAGLYLKPGGRLAMVLPLAVLTRGQFAPLRAGSYGTARLAFDEAWSFDDALQPLFPVPACAVFARRRVAAQALPEEVTAYRGTLPLRDALEDVADARLTVTREPRPLTAVLEGGSDYRKLFRQGATLVPRMLCLVERPPAGRLGMDSAAPLVRSRRSTLEKKPWSGRPGIENRVEAEFLRPVLLGESILPWRVFAPFEGVVPVDGKGDVLDAAGAANRGLSGLRGWMAKAEAAWKEGSADTMTLPDRWNFHGGLATQFPIAPLRVVYAASGTLPAAAIVRDPRAVIEHILYWTAPAGEDEAYYLAAILNSETARARTSGLQARGQWGARHFDKVALTLPIPRFDPTRPAHAALAALGREAETLAAAVPLPAAARFQRARTLVRTALAAAGLSARLDAAVATLLDGG